MQSRKSNCFGITACEVGMNQMTDYQGKTKDRNQNSQSWSYCKGFQCLDSKNEM